MMLLINVFVVDVHVELSIFEYLDRDIDRYVEIHSNYC